MDSLIIANLTQPRSSRKIASEADEVRYYRRYDRRFPRPALPVASIAAILGVLLLTIDGMPR